MDNSTEILNNTASNTDTENAIVKTSHKRVLVGKVKCNKADKTITVVSERQVIHPLYKKYYKVSKKFMAHDESNECNIGDIVKIVESRPLSSKKRWNLVEILKRAK
jgi:small subunit ribosomal protein S17